MKKKKIKQKSLQELELIFRLIEKHQIIEFEWEKDNEKLKFKTTQYASPRLQEAYSHPFLATTPSVEPFLSNKNLPPANTLNSTQEMPIKNKKYITSPLVGTFYRSPSPEATPYVQEGQLVKIGDVVCIIEAMKLMNEIQAECSGKVTAILTENGQPVEYGQPLFTIEPLSE